MKNTEKKETKKRGKKGMENQVNKTTQTNVATGQEVQLKDFSTLTESEINKILQEIEIKAQKEQELLKNKIPASTLFLQKVYKTIFKLKYENEMSHKKIVNYLNEGFKDFLPNGKPIGVTTMTNFMGSNKEYLELVKAHEDTIKLKAETKQKALEELKKKAFEKLKNKQTLNKEEQEVIDSTKIEEKDNVQTNTQVNAQNNGNVVNLQPEQK